MTVLGDTPSSDDLEQGSEAIPVGLMIPFVGDVAPGGWSMANGFEVPRDTPLGVFLNGRYGPGNGLSTYNKPDMRDRFPLGLAESGTAAVLGEAGGAYGHTHGPGAMTAPTHEHAAGTLYMPDHAHSDSIYIAGHVHDLHHFNDPIVHPNNSNANVSGAAFTSSPGNLGHHGSVLGSGAIGLSGIAATTQPGFTGATGGSHPLHQRVQYIIKE